MPARKPVGPTWKPNPKEIIVITNTSDQNLLLKLPTGRMRLDRGASQLMEASVLELPEVRALIDAGKITWSKRENGRR